MRLTFGILLNLFFLLSGVDSFHKVCFFNSEAWDRPSSDVNMDVSDIDPKLCSHLVWSYLNLDPNGMFIQVSKPIVDSRLKKFTNLKNKLKRNLTTMISVGGGDKKGHQLFESISETPISRKKFATNVVTFLKNRNLDGLVIDWRYPDKKETFGLFRELLKDLYHAFKSNGNGYTLAATMAGDMESIMQSYGDLTDVHRNVDFLLLLTYDYKTIPPSRVAAFNSPLKCGKQGWTNCVSWTVDHYLLTASVPPKKLVIGVALYGWRYVLADPNKNKPGSKVLNVTRIGRLYKMPGKLAYTEICAMRKRNETAANWDEVQQVPYLVHEDNFVSYDDKASIARKLKWMLGFDAGGLFLWTIDMDDYSGMLCDDGVYPLLNTANKLLKEVKRGYVETSDKDDGIGGVIGGGSITVLLTSLVALIYLRYGLPILI